MINFLKIFIVINFLHIFLFAHCQIPCGIYSDAMQITQIREDLKTIEKAMKMINSLSGKSDPQSINQLNRWITNKEKHAQNIQNIVSEYFLAQRIKEDSKNYINEITFLHRIIVYSMKCKQNVDLKNVALTQDIVNSFSELYFDKHGLKHLKKVEEF